MAINYGPQIDRLQNEFQRDNKLFDLIKLMEFKKLAEAEQNHELLRAAAQQGKPLTEKDKLLQEVKGIIAREEGIGSSALLDRAMGRGAPRSPGGPEGMSQADILRAMAPMLQAQGQAAAQQGPGPQQPPPMDRGIAAAPGAQSAAQPKAMAAGGIVAFSEGKEVKGTEEGKKAVTEADVKAAYEKWQEAKGPWYLPTPRANAEAVAREQQYGKLLNEWQRSSGSPIPAAPAQYQDPLQAAVPPSEGYGMGADKGVAALVNRNVPPPAPAAGPRPAARPVAAPAVPEQAGPQQVPYWMREAMADRARSAEAEEAARYKLANERLAPTTTEARSAINEGLAQLMAARAPARTRDQQIAEALMGMGSSRYLGLGIANAARGEAAAQAAQRQQQQEFAREMMNLKLKGADIERAGIMEALKQSGEHGKSVEAARREALAQGMHGYTSEEQRKSQEKIHELDRAARSADARIAASHNPQLELIRALSADSKLQETWSRMHPTDRKTVIDHYNDWLGKQSDLVKAKPANELLSMFVSTMAGIGGASGVPQTVSNPSKKPLDAGK